MILEIENTEALQLLSDLSPPIANAGQDIYPGYVGTFPHIGGGR
jgi:hypothetical protein